MALLKPEFETVKPLDAMSDEELIQQYNATGSANYLNTAIRRYAALIMGYCLLRSVDKNTGGKTAVEVVRACRSVATAPRVSSWKETIHAICQAHCDALPPAKQAKTSPQLWKRTEGKGYGTNSVHNLFFAEGLSYQQIAHKLKMPLHEVKMEIGNAKSNEPTA